MEVQAMKKKARWWKSGLAFVMAGVMMFSAAAPTGTVSSLAAEGEAESVETDAHKIVTSDAAALQFPEKHIVSDLTLPVQGALGSSIQWKSFNEKVISSKGAVTRPGKGEPDIEVMLEATVKMGDYTKTRKYSFVVLAEEEMGATESFELDEVEVLDEYYLSAQTSDIAFLKKFDNDRLLSRFRETAGVDTKGVPPYNGWENGLLGGHCVGHYLTAVAQAVKATGDRELKEKLEALIAGLAQCQDALGTGFIFGALINDKSNVELQFDILEKRKKGDTWVPWYNMHKMVAGLVDTYKYTGNEQALAVAGKLGDWIYNRVSKWDSGMQAQVLGTEYGGMNDCLYELYACTKDKKHLEAAHKFDEPALYETIARGGKNCLSGKHANTLIPKIVGALKRYTVLKRTGEAVEEDDAYLEGAEKFFDIAVKRHSYITGGVSVMEHFRQDSNQDGTRTQTNCESCCAHNMLKLARELFQVTGRKKYADYYETTLRNSIMGAVKANVGAAAYFLPMATGYYKTFGDPNPDKNMFWCCTGSGMENFTKLGDSMYFHTDDTLIVNQYVASEVTWKEKNLVVTQQSDVTKSETATFTVHSADESSEIASVRLALRVPDWMHGKAVVTVNGEIQQNAAASGGYIILTRDWKDGDVVTLEVPMTVDAFGLPDNHSVYAFRYGPTVLAAKLGKEKMGTGTWAGVDLTAPLYKVVGDQSQKITIKYGASKAAEPLANERLKIQDDQSVFEYIDQVEKYLVKNENSDTLSFSLKGTNAETTFGGGLEFVPFNTLNEERYGIYWYFDSLYAESDENQIRNSKENGRLDASILDSVQPGYGQYEKDAIHQMEEKDSEEGTIPDGGSTRLAKAGGYFTYQLIVNPDKGNLLLCQFAKEDNGKTLKILSGDTVIADKKLSYDGSDSFYSEYIPIPDEAVKKNAKKIAPQGDEKEYTVLPVRFESGSQTESSARLVGGLYMTQAYDTKAVLESLVSSAGELTHADNAYTITVPKGTASVTLNYTISSPFGLLYINDKLVDETKGQEYVLSGTPVTLSVKVYAEDHQTANDYQIQITEKPEGTPAGGAVTTPSNTGVNPNNPELSVKKQTASLSITGKKSVKKGKSIVLTVRKKNIRGKAKWTVNKKKLAKLNKKSGSKIVLKALKKGKVKVTVRVGKLKKTKTIRIR